MTTTQTGPNHVKILEALVQAEEKVVAKLLDALPDKAEAALTSAWDKFLGIVAAHPSGNASVLLEGVATVAEDVVEGKYAEAQAALKSLVKTEADHVSAHLGNLIQAMAEFSNQSNGVLSSLLQNAESHGLLGGPAHFAASTGNALHASTQARD